MNQLVQRVREAQTRLRNATGAAADTLPDRSTQLRRSCIREPVRYGKPGLQAHITYLAGMTTRADQKVGRDALERYEVLKKELDAIRAEADRLIGS